MTEDANKNFVIESQDEDSNDFEEEKIVRCKMCEQEITKTSATIVPHEHTFRNPLGITFDIACYRDAPGAEDVGVPTLWATWFPNYAWSNAHCVKCKYLIGWWFHGPDVFVGLIISNILR